jgi:hypothetical protein
MSAVVVFSVSEVNTQLHVFNQRFYNCRPRVCIFAKNIAVYRLCCNVTTDGCVYYGYNYVVKCDGNGPVCVERKY